MKWLNRISVLFMGIIFLLSATGILVFRTHCTCTDSEHVSIYVTPETCESNYHIHHTHGEKGQEVPSTDLECHECSAHTHECGCNDVNVDYIKLKNEVIQKKERFDTKKPVHIVKPQAVFVVLLTPINELPEAKIAYIDPPSDKTSLDFLIPIHQLKIPYLA